MHLLDIYIVVMPILHPKGVQPHLLDLFAVLAIGAPLTWLFLRVLSGNSLFPSKDPRLIESLKLTN
jgi:hypothetical protein